VQAHLLGAHEARHLVVAHFLERARRQSVVDGVEDQQRVGFLHMLDQVQALRAAIDEAHVPGELPAALQGLDAAHAEAFVGPQQVADAQYHDAPGRALPMRGIASGHGLIP